MRTGEVAVLAAAVAGALLLFGLFLSLVAARRSLRVLDHAVAESRHELARLAAAVRAIAGPIDPHEEAPVVDATPAPAYLSLSKPVIKARALGAGTSRAARRLRQRRMITGG